MSGAAGAGSGSPGAPGFPGESGVPGESGFPDLDAALVARIEAVCEEGREYWFRFDADVRQHEWHPFVAADYGAVFEALVELRRPGLRFLEWGSATGVVAIMADLMGFDAYGIELDASLVRFSRDLARRSGSNARFAVGSFIPMGWQWKPRGGDDRRGTIGEGVSGYLELGLSLSDFDVVYAFPWMGEEGMMLDLMTSYGREDASLLLHTSEHGARLFRGGRLQNGE